MSETESEKQMEEILQKIKQERALQQYREKIDDVFSQDRKVFCVQKVGLGSGSG